jgi:hypothetical protein
VPCLLPFTYISIAHLPFPLPCHPPPPPAPVVQIIGVTLATQQWRKFRFRIRPSCSEIFSCHPTRNASSFYGAILVAPIHPLAPSTVHFGTIYLYFSCLLILVPASHYPCTGAIPTHSLLKDVILMQISTTGAVHPREPYFINTPLMPSHTLFQRVVDKCDFVYFGSLERKM